MTTDTADGTATRLIADLGQRVGIPQLRPDAHGCCRLMFDGDQIVDLQPVPAQGRWLVSCTIRQHRPDDQAVRLLMQGNYLGAGLGGGWASLDPKGCAAVHLPLAFHEASVDALLQVVELVLQHAERWLQRFTSVAPTLVSGHRREIDWA